MRRLLKAKIYIDGANMFYAQQKMGWFIDWQKLIRYLGTGYRIEESRYYTGLKLNDQRMMSFTNRLKKYGYLVVTKRLKKIYVSPEERVNKHKYIYKANFDVEICVDMLLERDSFQIAILFSGDSDFEYLVRKLQKFGKRVIACGTERSISRELKTAADECILLGDIRSDIEYQRVK